MNAETYKAIFVILMAKMIPIIIAIIGMVIMSQGNRPGMPKAGKIAVNVIGVLCILGALALYFL